MMIISHKTILALQFLKGFGPKTIGIVCARLSELGMGGSISATELHGLLIEMISREELKRVSSPDSNSLLFAIDQAQNILDTNERLGIKTVSRYDKDFPKELLRTVSENGKPSVPIILHYIGDLYATKRPSLAVIGTRRPTQDGIKASSYYASAFSSIGVNIVSGLAVGCDTEAHRGALYGGGVTTAILANGLDTIFPSENHGLAEDIVSNGGLLLSEYMIGTKASKYNLVERDRLQTGLSGATLVIQTALNGGTMHAARTTLAAGKTLLIANYGANQGEYTEGYNFLEALGAQPFRDTKAHILSNAHEYLEIFGNPSPNTLFANSE